MPLQRPIPQSDRALREDEEFALDCLKTSLELVREWREEDAEVLENYMMVPYNTARAGTWDPYGRGSRYRRARLKDSETNQLVESLLAQMLVGTIGDSGFIQCQPEGSEDVKGAG